MDGILQMEGFIGIVSSIFSLAAFYILQKRVLGYKYQPIYVFLAILLSCNIPSFIIGLLGLESVYQWIFTGLYFLLFSILMCKGALFTKAVTAMIYACFGELTAYLSVPVIYLSGFYAPLDVSKQAGTIRILIEQSGMVMSSVLFFLIINFISNNLSVENSVKSLKYAVVFILPNIFIVTILCEYFRIYYSGGAWKDSWLGNLRMFGFSGMALICGGLVLVGLDKLMKENQKKEQEKLLRQQLTALVSHYEGLKLQLESSRAFRHDIRNHLACVKNLIEAGNYEEGKAYFDKLTEKIDGLGHPVNTGNLVADAVIYEKSKLCDARNISFHCDARIFRNTKLDSFDLCVILGNALDNGIEACGRMIDSNIEPYVRMKSAQNKNFLIIEIENSTGKQSKNIHYGIGLLNIKKIVEKYLGTMDIEKGENYFKLSIMLQV